VRRARLPRILHPALMRQKTFTTEAQGTQGCYVTAPHDPNVIENIENEVISSQQRHPICPGPLCVCRVCGEEF
jgi:hypothetical protein